jgi:ketosteroid isomerase-like protein
VTRRGALAGLVAAIALLGGAAGASADQPANLSAADSAAIHAVIASQIEAFRHDDANAAFDAAAPNIHARFGTAEQFLDVVRRMYQPVYRPRDYRFGETVTDGGELIQKVEVIGPDGTAATARYAMEKQPDGSWKISGCELTLSERQDT